MIPLLRHIFYSLLFDETAARRWLYGLVGFIATLASMVLVDGIDAAFTWDATVWRHKIITALVGLVFTMINPVGRVAPKPGAVIDLPPPRGFLRLPALLVLAAICLFAAAAYAADANPQALPDAIAEDPNAVQPEPDPAPRAPPKFGGCNKTGLFCWGPQAAAGLVRYDFKAKDFSLAFQPGLGYGVTFWTGRSYELGFAGYASIAAASGSQPSSGVFSFVASFAEYLRLGVGWNVIGGKGSGFMVGGIGTSFGAF